MEWVAKQRRTSERSLVRHRIHGSLGYTYTRQQNGQITVARSSGACPCRSWVAPSLSPRPSLNGSPRGSDNIPIVDLCRLAAFFPAT